MIDGPRRVAQTETLTLRNLQFRLYRWPGADPHPRVLVHGWGDTGETWQFLVDCFSDAHTWLAPDLRGFGRTQRPDDGYWFPDYLADLDALLDQVSPERPVDLVGHSMGGNVVMLYAGVRPQRVRRVVSLEAVGLPRTRPDEAPARYAQWLDEVKQGSEFATYDSYEQLMKVLGHRNPRTPADRLEFVARAWSHERPDRRIELWADPKHRNVNPVLYQREQAEACWRTITAPFLLVLADQSDLTRRMAAEIGSEQLHALFSTLTMETLRDTGHMVHHERPEELALLIERFLSD